MKGQFWETGQMVYKKEDAAISSNPRATLGALVDELRSARRYAEIGDLDSARRAIEAVSERQLRLVAATLMDAIGEDVAPRSTFARAMSAYDRADRAIVSRSTSPVISKALGALAASGLIFLFPPALVNAALQRTLPPNSMGSGGVYDAGLIAVSALDECIRSLDDFIAAIPATASDT